MMLLRDSPAHGGTGAFIRVESMDGQPYAAPFRELLPKPGWRHRKDTPSSVVMWQNYQPTEESRQLSLPPLRITPNAHVAREIQLRTASHTDVSRSVEGTGKAWAGLRRSYLLPARKPEADHRSNEGDVTPGGYPALFRPADPEGESGVYSSTAAPASCDGLQCGEAAHDRKGVEWRMRGDCA